MTVTPSHLPPASPRPSPRLTAALPLLSSASAAAARARATRRTLLVALAVGSLVVVTLGLATEAAGRAGAAELGGTGLGGSSAASPRGQQRRLAFAPAAVNQLGASILNAVGIFFYTEAVAGLTQLLNLFLRGFGFQAVPLG